MMRAQEKAKEWARERKMASALTSTIPLKGKKIKLQGQQNNDNKNNKIKGTWHLHISNERHG